MHFDEGQGLSEHTAPFDALVQVLEGEVEISIDRKPLSAKAGDVVLRVGRVQPPLRILLFNIIRGVAKLSA